MAADLSDKDLSGLPKLPRPDLGMPWRVNAASDGSVHSTGFTADQMRAYARAALASRPAGDAVSDDKINEMIEAIRQVFNELPRYSFYLSDPPGVVRVPSRYGNWVEWDAAHCLFDREAVDAAVAKLRAKRAIQAASDPSRPARDTGADA